MPRTEDSRLLRLLSVPENVRFLLILLLSVAATSVFGQEKVKILAMLRYDQPALRTPVVVRADSVANSFRNVSIPRLQYRVAGLTPDNQNATGFAPDALLEEQSNSNQGDLFQLVHKRLSAAGRMGKWMDVEAGYGEIIHGEFSIGESTVELQRPGCAYLKASLSF